MFFSLKIILLTFLHVKAGGAYMKSDGADNGWLSFNGHRYKKFEDKKNWSEAWDECKTHNAYLVVITSEEEDNFLKNNTPSSDVYYWIGLMLNPNKKGEHRSEKFWWVEKETHPKDIPFTGWANGEPNNANPWDEDCVEVYRNGGWNDIICASKNRYWCEQEPENTTQSDLTTGGVTTGGVTAESVTRENVTAENVTTKDISGVSTESITNTGAVSTESVTMESVTNGGVTTESVTKEEVTMSEATTDGVSDGGVLITKRSSTTVTRVTRGTTGAVGREDEEGPGVSTTAIAIICIFILLAGIAAAFYFLYYRERAAKKEESPRSE